MDAGYVVGCQPPSHLTTTNLTWNTTIRFGAKATVATISGSMPPASPELCAQRAWSFSSFGPFHRAQRAAGATRHLQGRSIRLAWILGESEFPPSATAIVKLGARVPLLMLPDNFGHHRLCLLGGAYTSVLGHGSGQPGKTPLLSQSQKTTRRA